MAKFSFKTFLNKDKHPANKIADKKHTEIELRNSNNMFFSIFDQEAVGVAQINTKTGQFIRVNQRYCDITGYSKEEVTAKTFMKLTHTDDLQADLDNMKQLVNGKIDRFSMEKRYIHKDGAIVWITLSVSPNWEKGEEPDYHIAVIEDITERKQAEAKLRESEEIFRALFEQAGGYCMILNPNTPDGIPVIIDANEAACSMHGYTHEEFIGRPVADIDDEDGKHLIKKRTAEIMTGKQFYVENEHVRKDGTTFSVAVNAKRIDIGNKPPFILTTEYDITERKRSEEKLRNSIVNLKESVKAGNVGLWNWDLITNKVYYSPEWKKQIGYEDDELINDYSEWEDRIHPDDLKQTVDITKKSIDQVNHNHRSEFRFRHKDGSYRWIFAQGSFIQNEEGQPIRMVGSHLDITEQKKAAEEKHALDLRIRQNQKMEAIGTLAGGIAHDFNNILFPLLGFTEMLQEDLPKDSPLQDNAHEILQAALRAKDLVQQILAFSRQQEQELKPIKIQSILEEALKLLVPSLPKTINIQTEIDPYCGVVLTDGTQIHQVIMNLATNAYHAMQMTGGKLTISLNQIQIKSKPIGLSELIPGNYALLKVIDTGAGIKKDIIDKIFDPYFTTKTQNQGTGLGLSVVKNIVISYNGDIHIYSEPDKGTEVHVYLPIIKKTTEIGISKPLEDIKGGFERVLLIDDEIPIIKMEKRILERLGYQVTSHTNSIEALQAFKENPYQFDLIISDMTMPNMTGLRLANEIKRIRTDIPVIICSGFSDLINIETYKEIGIQGYIPKPVIKSDMAQIIRDVLEKSNKSDTI